ncbi:MAG: hypothetical protein EBR40_09115 [Proteobacteria bacterium]|nr:hypothetical protein [Pseudomonadota bacterium]
MSQNFYHISDDGTCTAYGIEVWGGQPLPDPPGDPFKHRWIDGAWVPIPVEELPVQVTPLEQQLADLRQQVADMQEIITSLQVTPTRKKRSATTEAPL